MAGNHPLANKLVEFAKFYGFTVWSLLFIEFLSSCIEESVVLIGFAIYLMIYSEGVWVKFWLICAKLLAEVRNRFVILSQ